MRVAFGQLETERKTEVRHKIERSVGLPGASNLHALSMSSDGMEMILVGEAAIVATNAEQALI
jgi:hypothetical protein